MAHRKCHNAQIRRFQRPADSTQRDETCGTDLNDNFNLPRHHAQGNGTDRVTIRPDIKSGPKKKMTNNNKKSKKKNPTCNALASTNEGEGDRHLAVRTRAEKRRKRKAKRHKHHAVRAHKYGQVGLEPGHSDTIDLCFEKKRKYDDVERKEVRC